MTSIILKTAARLARLLPMPLKRLLYTIKPLGALLRRALNSAAPDGLQQIQIAAGSLVSAHLLLDLHAEKDYWLGTYEPELQHAATDLIQPGATVYDAGANIGYISLLLARAAGENGQVFAFEALPANQERLRANLSLNPEQYRITLVSKAVAAEGGEISFLVHSSGGMGKAVGSAGRQTETYQETITVPAVSLDNFVYEQGNPPPDVIKMDIEGGEVMVLPAMHRIFMEAKPLIFIELHGPSAAQTAWQTLTQYGYSLHQMKKGYPRINSLEEIDWKAYIIGKPPAQRPT